MKDSLGAIKRRKVLERSKERILYLRVGKRRKKKQRRSRFSISWVSELWALSKSSVTVAASTSPRNAGCCPLHLAYTYVLCQRTFCICAVATSSRSPPLSQSLSFSFFNFFFLPLFLPLSFFLSLHSSPSPHKSPNLPTLLTFLKPAPRLGKSHWTQKKEARVRE